MPTRQRQGLIKAFFYENERIDYEVLRPLSHIRANWELTWDASTNGFLHEEDSLAQLFNELIEELSSCKTPRRYHDNEDRLGQFVVRRLNWQIAKKGKRWVWKDGRSLRPDDYIVLLEQGAFDDVDESEMVAAAAGRIIAALDRGQRTFDKMERSHRYILAGVLSAILYHRAQVD